MTALGVGSSLVNVEVEHVEVGAALAELPPAAVVGRPGAWAELTGGHPGARLAVAPSSLEELDLDRLVTPLLRSEDGNAPGRLAEAEVEVVVGIGGGVALDTAKYVALRSGLPLVLVPTALSSLAPFTTDVARRVRRQTVWVGDVAGRALVDLGLLGTAPPARNRAGAAEVVATISATWDWRLADARDRGLPFSPGLDQIAVRCRHELGAAREAVAAASPDGLRLLADLLATLGQACARAGHRRLVEGSEHTFTQAYEHRLGRPSHYGELVGLGTVAMATLQAWYGVSAGGVADPDAAIDLLGGCQVAANPHQLGLDEGTFRGVLRHAVRFHVGELLPWSVLNEADLNFSAAEEMWRRCWQVPVVRG